MQFCKRQEIVPLQKLIFKNMVLRLRTPFGHVGEKQAQSVLTLLGRTASGLTFALT